MTSSQLIKGAKSVKKRTHHSLNVKSRLQGEEANLIIKQRANSTPRNSLHFWVDSILYSLAYPRGSLLLSQQVSTVEWEVTFRD